MRPTNTQGDDVLLHDAKLEKSINSPPSENKIIGEQADGNYCSAASLHICYPDSEFQNANRGILIRQSPVDNATQIVAPVSLRKRKLYQAHYPTIAGDPGYQRKYNTL